MEFVEYHGIFVCVTILYIMIYVCEYMEYHGMFVCVAIIMLLLLLVLILVNNNQETYVKENPKKYELVDEETAKKRQRMQQFRVDMSHEDIARMDRVYTSKELLPVEFHTNTFYIDHGGSHKLCVMEVVKGEDDTLVSDHRIANGVETASVGFGSLGQENEAATRMMTSLEEVLGKLSTLEADMKGVQGALKDIKSRI